MTKLMKNVLGCATGFLLGAVVFFSDTSLAQQREPNSRSPDDSVAAEKTCDGNQLDVNLCIAGIYHDLDSRMNALYGQVMGMERLGPVSKAALRDAQRAWIAFRDKSCLYEAGKDPRSYTEMIEFSCLARHTRRRIEDLNSYLACTENGCPSD